MGVLEKVRRWIDGDTAEAVLEDAARDAQIKPRSEAEEFIVKIARKVEEVMQEEMVPLPQGTTIIPTEYIIFLSEDDDREWQGVKRRGLEQGLHHILAERAKEIAGKKKLKTKSFAIELRVDGTLQEGEIVIEHGWEEHRNEKTGVIARKKPHIQPTKPPQPQPNINPPTPNFTTPANFTQPQTPMPAQPTRPNPQTSPDMQEGEEMTHVNSRVAALYNLEIWRNNTRQNLIPIYKNEIVIGRGSKSKPVDIQLSGDPEISRRHLVLILSPTGEFFAINEGRNPAILNNAELPIGQRISITQGQTILVCSYMLRIQTGN